MLNKTLLPQSAPVRDISITTREAQSPFLWTVAYRMKQKPFIPLRIDQTIIQEMRGKEILPNMAPVENEDYEEAMV
ncbi:MAG: hypothetical protein ACO1QB_11615 [Verrucomicrobiales bacterium]